MFARSLPTPAIDIAGARVRVSRRVAGRIASTGIKAALSITDSIKECPLGDVVAELENAAAILAITDSTIEQVEAVAAELDAVARLLTDGTLDGTATAFLSSAESIRAHSVTLQAAAPEVALDEVDDLAGHLRGLSAALRADCDVARGRREKIEGAAQRAAAIALSRSDTTRAGRKAVLPAQAVLPFGLPPELAELAEGLPLYRQAEAARTYISDQKAARDAVAARRKDAERQHISGEIERLWA